MLCDSLDGSCDHFSNSKKIYILKNSVSLVKSLKLVKHKANQLKTHAKKNFIKYSILIV